MRHADRVDDLVERGRADALLTLTRGQETRAAGVGQDQPTSRPRGLPPGRRRGAPADGRSGRVAQAELPIVLDGDHAAAIAETWLFEAWAARERASFVLPPSALAIEPGDVVALIVQPMARASRCA